MANVLYLSPFHRIFRVAPGMTARVSYCGDPGIFSYIDAILFMALIVVVFGRAD